MWNNLSFNVDSSYNPFGLALCSVIQSLYSPIFKGCSPLIPEPRLLPVQASSRGGSPSPISHLFVFHHTSPSTILIILLLYNLQIFSSEMIYSTDIFTFVFMTSQFRSLFSFRLTHEHSSSLFPSQRWNIYQQKVLETKPFNIKHQKHQILFWEIIFRGAIFCGGGL